MSIVVSPLYPIGGQSVTVTSTLNDTGTRAEQIILEITSRPPTSTYPLGLVQLDHDDPATSALEIATRDLDTNIFIPDVAGAYGVTVHHYLRMPALPAQFGLDSTARWKLKDSESGTVHVGARMRLPIVTESGDGAVLQIDAVNTTARNTQLVEQTTEKARVAMLQTTVTAALTAIDGTAIASIGTDLQTGVNDLLSKHEAHRVFQGGGTPVHLNQDTTNQAKKGAANDQAGAIALLNRLREVLIAHAQTSAAATTKWHTDGVDDLKNFPLIGPASTLAQATVLLADLRERVYERHRVQTASPAVHGAADSTNVLSAPSKLDDAIVAFLDALAILDPTAPNGESEGAQDLTHKWGFAKDLV